LETRFAQSVPLAPAECDAEVRRIGTVATVFSRVEVSITIRAVFVCVLLIACQHSSAQSRYGDWIHLSWDARKGAPNGISQILKGKDGFLWMASSDGVFRFDGAAFEQIPMPPGTNPSVIANHLIKLRNGDLWVSTPAGIALIHEGRFERFMTGPAPLPKDVNGLAQDIHGDVWAAAGNGLFRFTSGRWMRLGAADGLPVTTFYAIFQDRDERLWVSAQTGVYFRDAGDATFHRRPDKAVMILQFLQDSAGRIWVSDLGDSVHPIFSPQAEDPLLRSQVRVGSDGSLFDSDGELWITSVGDGLRKVEKPDKPFGVIKNFGQEAASFTRDNGLTDNFVFCIFQDDDGAIWVGTRYGLDCFRKARIVSRPDPVAPIARFLMEPGDKGDTWFVGAATFGHIWLDHGNVSSKWVTLVRSQRVLPPVSIKSEFEARAPAICSVTEFGPICSDGDWVRVTPFPPSIPLGYSQGRAWLDAGRTLWLATQDYGVLYLDGKTWKTVPLQFGKPAFGPTALMGASDGAEWVAFGEQLVTFRAGKQEFLPAVDKLNLGTIRSIAQFENHIWIGGTNGLGFYDFEHCTAIRTQGVGGLKSITGIQETRKGDLWVATTHGLIHIDKSEIARAREDTSYSPTFDQFGPQDGLPGMSVSAEQLASNGVLILFGTDGIGYIDTNQADKTGSPPKLTLRSIEANGRDVPIAKHINLNPGMSNIKLHFIGIDFIDPGNVTYKYKLSGVDQDWQYAGTQSQVAYTNLPPGHYPFHVITRRGSGPWSQDRELVSIDLAPAWYQRLFTRIAALLLALAVIVLYFRYRLKIAEAAILTACDARMGERLRLSADIHDTFLQTVQGSKLIAEDALVQIGDGSPAHVYLERIAKNLNIAVEEGRKALRDLRVNQSARNDLTEAVSHHAAQECAVKNLSASVRVVGQVRLMHPVVQDEILQISKEAIRNACAHSNGRNISVTLTYGSDFSAEISDDGVGIPPSMIETGRDGHFGLDSMHQRASRIGGRLRISSEPGNGTTVLAEIPGPVAYLNQHKSFFRSIFKG